MAASTRFFSLAAIVTVASSALAMTTTPVAQEVAHRASGRISNELAHRGSERINDAVAYRGSGRIHLQDGSGLLAYRGSGRFAPSLAQAYRGSERGIQTA